jgi:sulfate permease, SulP family
MATAGWFLKVRGDIAGGAMSAIVAIPLAAAYGMFVFGSLGDRYFAHGVLAGLYTALVVGVVSVSLGDRSTHVYAPRIITTFFLGSILTGLVHSDAAILRTGGLAAILGVFFLIVLLGGAFQALAGLLRVGDLLKFTPYPVMAGFQNAAALLLFLVQIGNVLGFPKLVPFQRLFDHLGEAKPTSLAIGIVTFAAMWNARKFAGRVPPLVVGLMVGTVCYYAIVALGFSDALGAPIGDLPRAGIEPINLPVIADLVRSDGLWELALTVIGGALGLAFIASIDALLCSRLLESATGGMPRSDAQLLRLGVGNIVSACFGGITSGINVGPTVTGRTWGARTPLAVLVSAAAIFLTLAVFLPALAYLPRAVLSAAVMVVAIQHVDQWTMQLVRRAGGRGTLNRSAVVLELCVVAAVAALSLTLGIVEAVFAGIIIAIAIFLLRMSKSVVRRKYRGDVVHSRRTRSPALRDFLVRHGDRIVVMELEGAIFFGSAERLTRAIEIELARATEYVILDLRRVTEIDSTGGQLLLRIQSRLAHEGKHLLFCGLDQATPWGRLLGDLGLPAAVTSEKLFSEPDRAIEWAEEALIAAGGAAPPASEELSLEGIEFLINLTGKELAIVSPLLRRRQFAKGDIVFREGDSGTELMIIVHGTASVHLPDTYGRATRLVTFSAGTFFGELAIIDNGLRSATVIADDVLVCYAFDAADLEALGRTHPSIAIKLVANIGRELSRRLRLANGLIRELHA